MRQLLALFACFALRLTLLSDVPYQRDETPDAAQLHRLRVQHPAAHFSGLSTHVDLEIAYESAGVGFGEESGAIRLFRIQVELGARLPLRLRAGIAEHRFPFVVHLDQ